jgi:hypothetical protein
MGGPGLANGLHDVPHDSQIDPEQILFRAVLWSEGGEHDDVIGWLKECAEPGHRRGVGEVYFRPS